MAEDDRLSSRERAEVPITFVNAGHDGGDIESQRAGETEWTHVAFDGFSPYTDTRALLVAGQPEERRYRLRYRDNDVPVSSELKPVAGGHRHSSPLPYGRGSAGCVCRDRLEADTTLTGWKPILQGSLTLPALCSLGSRLGL